MKLKINKYVIIVVVYLIIMGIVVYIFTREYNNYKEDENLELYNVEINYTPDDSLELKLYNQYQVEDGLLFSFIGSNMYEEYYGSYYRDGEFLSNFLRNIILIEEADYGTWDYDMDNRCYKLSLEDYKKRYRDFYDEDIDEGIFDELGSRYNEVIMVDENSICIADTIRGREYNKFIDTYLVDSVKEEDNIIIYEKVVFIEIKDDYYYFYRDYEMKDLVYKLKNISDVDISFINSSEVVSNVLLEYKDELDTYQYTFVKGVDTYYLESIKK